MAALYSDLDQYDAITAANAATDGEKESTFLSVWQQRLGLDPTLNLYREGTLVWQAVIDGYLPISGSSFVVPADGVQQYIATADIDAGDWEFRIEKGSDPSVYYGADVTKAGDTDVLALSDDLASGGSLTTGVIVFNAPSLDTEPAAISRNDSRVVMWADPNYTFANQLHGYGLQIRDATNGDTVWDVSEPGVIGTGSTYTLSRAASPYADGTCFKHVTSPSFPAWGSTQRSQYRLHTTLLDATTYWLCHEFTIEADWDDAEYSDWRDGFSTGDIHHNSWTTGPYGVLPGVRAPIELALCGTTPSYSIKAHGNYTPGSGGRTETTLFSSGTVTAGQTHRFVVRFRIGRSWADAPFIQVWRQVDAGAETLIVDRSDVMIGYSDMQPHQCYPKMGLYGWDTGAAAKTTYTKGAICLREASGNPEITATEMFTLLRSL